MEFPLSESVLQDYEEALVAAQKEKRRIKIKINNRRIQTIQAFEDVCSNVQSDDNKSLKDLEDDYHKIYMSKINLSEKLLLTSQIYHLLFGINDTQKSDEKPFIGKYEEEAWIKDMQNLDMDLLNIPYMIEKMSNVWTYNENGETDKILTKWYSQLKTCLHHVPTEKNLTSSELLLVDVVAYDITYNFNKLMIKFSTRRSGHVVQVCITSVNSPHFKINFDFPLIESTNKFHKTFRMDELSPDLDFPDFIKYVIWNEMDELFDDF